MARAPLLRRRLEHATGLLDNNGDPLTCDFGDNPLTAPTDVFECNDKLVAGHAFLETYNIVDPGGETFPDSARDSDGHGTHTATTSAGGITDSEVLGVDRGEVSGIAPGAWVAIYKVCGPVGCFSTDSMAAVEQAVLDGVDVINFSISGGTNPFTDPVELAFLDAYAAGVFVAASAGNEGPGASTANHLSPWVTSVGASTQAREFASTLTLEGESGDPLELTGASITAGAGPAPVVLAGDVLDYEDPLCIEEPDPGVFEGLIVACERGVSGRVEKSFVVFEGGGEGMILYNPSLADVETDNHWVPTVHLADPTSFVAFMDEHAGEDITGEFTAGVAVDGQGDVMAAFSSRGPAGLFVKPDVTAPGVQILAGHSPVHGVLGGPEGELFQAIAGTSMSSPHTAGAALLLAALHDDWTPGQVRSALMTTATQDVVEQDLSTPADPFDMGAGRIDLNVADDPGLTFDETAVNMAALGASPLTAIDLNIPSINAPNVPGRVSTTRTVTNVGGTTATYNVATTSPPGGSISASPSSFTLTPGASETFAVTITTDRRDGEQLFGEIRLSAAGRAPLHLPVALIPTPAEISLASSCDDTTVEVDESTACDVVATNSSFSDTTVDITSTVSPQLEVTGASVNGTTPTFNATSATLNDFELAGRDAGVPSLEIADFGALGPELGDGYVPLDLFGIDPIPVGDENFLNFDVDPFVYNGVTYDSIGVTTNGYIVTHEATQEDVSFFPQDLPNPVAPNDVLAPFWSDLTGEGDEDPAPDGIFVAELQDGPNSWTVVEWRLNAFGTDDLKIFELWIGHNGVQDISFDYDPDFTNLDGLDVPGSEAGDLTVGAENENGSGGEDLDADEGSGDHLPETDLIVESTDPAPGDSVTFTVTVQGNQPGPGTVTSEATSPVMLGVATASSDVLVAPLPPSAFEAFVARAYVDFLDRNVDPAGLAYWSGLLSTGVLTRQQFVEILADSDEYLGAIVTELYEHLLGRAPDAAGAAYWVGLMRGGTQQATVVAALVGSAEFFANAGSTNEGFVDAAYLALLGRSAEPGGIAYWVGLINGGTPRTTVSFALYQSLESRNVRVVALYDELLARAPDPAGQAFWVEVILVHGDVALATFLAASDEYFNLP